MMQALDADTGMAVAGADARRGARYLCPQCRARVGLRLGMRKIPHFAHYSLSPCALAEPESPRHRALKWLCKKFFAPWPVVWEVPVGERRVDVLVDGRLVVECQTSRVSVQEWHARTANHNRLGYPVLWLWDVKRLCRKNTLAEALVLQRNRRDVCVPQEIRVCHDEGRGLIFVADRHDLLPCRLIALSDGEHAAARRRGSPAALYWPHALRKLMFFPDFDKSARSHFASRSGRLRLVRLGSPGEYATLEVQSSRGQ